MKEYAEFMINVILFLALLAGAIQILIEILDYPPPQPERLLRMKVMPRNVVIFNASNEPCDMLEGPCCCGAWHKPGELLAKIEKLKPPTHPPKSRRKRDEC